MARDNNLMQNVSADYILFGAISSELIANEIERNEIELQLSFKSDL
jgi:ribosomal protein L9